MSKQNVQREKKEEKGRNLTQSYDKSPISTKKSKERNLTNVVNVILELQMLAI